MELIFGIISAIIAIISLFISIYTTKNSRYMVVDKYFECVESETFIKAKKHVYTTDELSVDDEQAAIIVNFFHHWGLLAKKKYLPMWVFDGATGKGMLRLYERTKSYIEARQKYNNDNTYGEYFLWLYNKVQKQMKNN